MTRATCVAALVLAIAADATFAQGVQTGSLRVRVRDEQGLAVVGATITITAPVLQGQRIAQTNDDGSVVEALLPPGDYTLRVEQALFAPAARAVVVPLGGVVEVPVTLFVAQRAEQITVTPVRPSPLSTTTIGLNLTQTEVETLPTPRDLSAVARLSPGVTDNAPDQAFGQIAVNGAFGFDSIFLVDGVDITDGLFGYPHNLFIEDAIQETQILTAGVPAEYGRFTGGVVNAISRSGGNALSASLRLLLANPAWSTETPREQTASLQRGSLLNESWEGTAGGPIVRDRLWAFGAGRFSTTALAESLPVTNTAYRQNDGNRRGEVKGTGTLAPGHTIQASYIQDRLHQEDRPATPGSIDTWSLISPVQRNWYMVTTYRGVVRRDVLVEASYAERRFRFEDFGGRATDPVDSPFLSFDLEPYNAPWFDAADEEVRANRQLTGTLTRFVERFGGHQLKGGVEWFRSRQSGGNSLSSTGLVFITPYDVDDAGAPLFDAAGHLMPLFLPGVTQLAESVSAAGTSFGVDTTSWFAQDRWSIGRRVSVDIGVRVEHVRSFGTPPPPQPVRSTTAMPRLAASYDLRGDGSHILQGSYGWYAGRHVATQAGANSHAIIPDIVTRVYLGPPGAGRDFADGFDEQQYVVAAVQSTDNVFLDPGLRAPVVREWTLSYGATIGASGYVEGAYVGRRTAHLIEDVIDIRNGATTLALEDDLFETVTNVVWANVDAARRVYDALQFLARYDRARLTLRGHYTIQVRNAGNYVGESSGRPGETSAIGNYPEILTAERHFPDGNLPDFQRHRLRVWGLYDLDVGAAGRLALTALWRIDSGRTYSLMTALPGLTAIQRARLLDAGYPEGATLAAAVEGVPEPLPDYLGPPQTIFFGSRGAHRFKASSLLDGSVTYALPMFQSVRPYLKVDVWNVLNSQTPIAFNTAVEADPDSPLDSLGLPTGYIQGPRFGEPDDNRHYPAPLPGLTGGRTIHLSMGFRF